MSLFTKPLPGTPINFAHPLCPLSYDPTHLGGFLLPLNEGSGRPRAYLGPFMGVAPTTGGNERLATISGAKWNPSPGAAPSTSKWSGPSLATVATTDTINFGVAADFLSQTQTTIVIGMRKRDTTNRVSDTFGVNTLTASQFCLARIPDSTGLVRWLFGGNSVGASEVDASGLSFGDDVWVLNVGPRGMEIYQNGTLVASQTAHATRTGNVNDFYIGGIPALANASDIVDFHFLYIYPWQLSRSECVQISNDPFCFYDWGEDLLPSLAAAAQPRAYAYLVG